MAELLRQRGEGRRAVEQPLIDLDAGDRIARIELAGFLPEIFEDRAGFAERHGRAAGAVVIDDRRDLVAGADLQELRLHLRLFADVDRNDLVREPGFLEHHARLVAVVGGPGVAVDHGVSPPVGCLWRTTHAAPVTAPSPLAGEGRADISTPSVGCGVTNYRGHDPSPILLRGDSEWPSPARGDGTVTPDALAEALHLRVGSDQFALPAAICAARRAC